ncbi:methyl-accepting chemotaxis sensory transducer [Candidatus Moduliflexus flocculans]|uniref:Methyl-accepting chemotaxis sensory transducer n=1 Tax=Candidatus Moduliflexus flocculans TaxID=1499966 RepID=A0A0S6VUP3_9BACT|nr:methyl-accepting chemotaxis sensory transducer [Candidatus Moduliflexus flocculans]
MMMRRLGTKLILQMSAVIFLIVAIFGFLSVSSQQKEFTALLDAKITRTMQQRSIVLGTPLWEMGYAQIDRILQSYLDDADVLDIQVLSEKGATIRHLGKHPETHEIAPVEQTDAQDALNGVVHQADIEYDGKKIGAVAVTFSQQFIRNQQQKLLLGGGLLFLALVCFQAILLSLLIRLNVSVPLGSIAQITQKIGEGDMTARIPTTTSRDEISQVLLAMKNMETRLNSTLLNVREIADIVAGKSLDISALAEQVSQGNAQQASASEEASASMEQMAANIRQNTENAKATELMALESAKDARQGGEVVAKTMQAMKEIETRISVIRELAMQTNILSMNATIEAAKAEEYGKGFAVVASEVRGLARRSREAADEIERLVKACVIISEEAGAILQRLVPSSEKTAALVQEISYASREQSVGTEQVNGAIQQLDLVIQQNATAANKMATASEELAEQAESLQQAVAFFTIAEIVPESYFEETGLEKAFQKLLKTKEGKEQVIAFLGNIVKSSAKGEASSKKESDTPGGQSLALFKKKKNRKEDLSDGEKDETDQDFEPF